MAGKLHWKNITVRLGDLKAWAENPKFSTKAQAQRIIDSFKKFDQVQTIAVSPDLEVYDGHQRLSALLTIHGEDYKIDARQSNRHLTTDERKELVITLHSGAVGSYDWQALSGWNAKELQGWGLDSDTLKGWNNDANNLKELLNASKEEPVDAEPQIDRAQELLEKWKVKTGDLWQIGEHRLLCGDSTKRDDVERVMQGDKADITFIDPPYGVDYEGGAQNENKREKLEGDDSGDLYLPVLKLCKEFSNKHSPMYVWFAASVGKPVYDAVDEIGYKVRAMIIWNKIDAHYGAYMAQYMQKHEPCLYIVDGASKFIGASNEVTVWDVKQPSKNEFHPTQKPVELALRAIGNHDAPIVIDFCSGSGTSIVASENLKRKCRAIEKKPEFVAVQLERMSIVFPHLEIKKI